MLTTPTRIEHLVQRHLTGRRRDLVMAVNELLALASEVGQVRCTMSGKDTLRFEVPGEEPVESVLPLAKANLRSMCARLAKLRQESGQEFECYGGDGIITREAVVTSYAEYVDWLKEQQRAVPDDRNGSDSPPGTELPAAPALTRERWKVSYKNTTGQQEFTIIAE